MKGVRTLDNSTFIVDMWVADVLIPAPSNRIDLFLWERQALTKLSAVLRGEVVSGG